MTAATPEEIRRITQNVLDRPEFLPRLDWTRLIFETVWKWLRQIAEWSARNPDLSKWLIIVLSILLVLLLAHIIYTVGASSCPSAGVTARTFGNDRFPHSKESPKTGAMHFAWRAPHWMRATYTRPFG